MCWPINGLGFACRSFGLLKSYCRMWACQEALHAIWEMTALKQSQLMVKTRRGQRSVTLVTVLECGIADTPPNPPTCHQLLNFQDDPSCPVYMFHKCVSLLKEPRAARLVNKLNAGSVPIGRRLLVRTNNHVMTALLLTLAGSLWCLWAIDS